MNADELRGEIAYDLENMAYGLELDWAKVSVGIERVAPVFGRFQAAVNDYFDTLP